MEVPMISKNKIQKLADIYGIKILDSITLHDCNKAGCISDYMKLKVNDKHGVHQIYVYLTDDYNLVTNKEFYIECKIKNALFNGM